MPLPVALGIGLQTQRHHGGHLVTDLGAEFALGLLHRQPEGLQPGQAGGGELHPLGARIQRVGQPLHQAELSFAEPWHRQHARSLTTAYRNAPFWHEYAPAYLTLLQTPPDRLWDYGKTAVSRGLKVIIAGAGGAAHLPGMMASKTRVPVIGVPVQTKALSGVDSLYSILQMPKGYPVATMAIGGAANAGLMAAAILAVSDPAVAAKLDAWRDALSASIPEEPSDD